MEVIGLLLSVAGVTASILALFSRTDHLLREIRDVLIEIRDTTNRHDRRS